MPSSRGWSSPLDSQSPLACCSERPLSTWGTPGVLWLHSRSLWFSRSRATSGDARKKPTLSLPHLADSGAEAG